MRNRKLWIGLAGGLLFIGVVALIVGLVLSKPKAPVTGSSQASSTLSSSEGTILYLCYLNDKSHTKVLSRDVCKWSAQDIIHAQTDYAYTLPGDIQGQTYKFNIWFESIKTTSTFTLQIVLRKGGSEAVLSSVSIEATKNGYQLFTIKADGIDPTTVNGDVLIFRIIPQAGVDGAILYTSDKTKTSAIVISPIK
jgi:hypothetical protein